MGSKLPKGFAWRSVVEEALDLGRVPAGVVAETHVTAVGARVFVRLACRPGQLLGRSQAAAWVAIGLRLMGVQLDGEAPTERRSRGLDWVEWSGTAADPTGYPPRPRDQGERWREFAKSVSINGRECRGRV